MNKYISDWLEIIEEMSNSNTYKLAWGRAILEYVSLNECKLFDDSYFYVDFDSISKLMIKYYWNQIFFFNLKQGPKGGKEVVIVKFVNKLISRYKDLTDSCIPVWFNDAEKIFKAKDPVLLSKIISKTSTVLHENVSHRFLNVGKAKKEVYLYDKSAYGSKILIKKEDLNILKDYAVVLSRLLNFKWAQLLEKYNFAPKISLKVSGLSDAKIKRNTLKAFEKELLKQFKDGKIIDFYTGKEISKDDISLDHVIPWSFMYSDNIWNLVITSKSNNSSKSNKLVSKEYIDKLKQRNKELIKVVEGAYKEDLLLADELGYVDKYYYDFRM